MSDPIYRLVCTARNTEKVVTHIMGIDDYKFTYDDAVALGEEVNGLDDRLQVHVEIECPVHGWAKSMIGECYECQREAADNVNPDAESDAYDENRLSSEEIAQQAHLEELGNLDRNPYMNEIGYVPRADY